MRVSEKDVLTVKNDRGRVIIVAPDEGNDWVLWQNRRGDVCLTRASKSVILNTQVATVGGAGSENAP